MRVELKDWTVEARETAEGIASDHEGEIAEALAEDVDAFKDGWAAINSNELEMFRDHVVHESCDSSFIYGGLVEWAQCIEQLSEYQETDSGLWDGCDAEKQIMSMAFYTFYNAVMSALADVLTDMIGTAQEAAEEQEGEETMWDYDSDKPEADCTGCGETDHLDPAGYCESCDEELKSEARKKAIREAVEGHF
jgi:hypothetical protein